MRLLIYGSLKNPNTTASFFVRSFEKPLAYEILKFPDEFAGLLRNKSFQFLYRFFPIVVVRMMDLSFLRQAKEFKPTVVLIFKGMEISSWSLKRVKKMGVKLVNYNFDHPFHHFSRGSGNRFVTDAIPLYDLHITYSAVIQEQLTSRFGVETSRVPFGFHLSAEDFEKVVSEKRPEINRACFVGNPDHLRVDSLRRLIQENIPISLYGFGWDKYFTANEQVEIHKPRRNSSFWADPLEFWKILRQYRVQLNFFRPHNEGSHNLRTFEVPAVGGILLTPESGEQKLFFDDGVEVFFYSDFNSLLSQCRFIMSASTHLIDSVREKARLRSLKDDYSYKRRTKDLLNLLSTIHSK
jgi:spore maturation protein CgeB